MNGTAPPVDHEVAPGTNEGNWLADLTAEIEAIAPGQTRSGYQRALNFCDVAVCEGNAVSQAQAGRMAPANVGYATHVFAQMCGHGMSLMRAAPLTRWTRSDFQHWHFGALAPYCRAVLDGSLLFQYLMRPTESEEELRVRINVMHLNDCTRRIEMMNDLGVSAEELRQQQAELQDRLRSIDYFTALPRPTQTNCLNGKFLTIETRDELIASMGAEKGMFDAMYDLLSQHTHILPMSFYRMEPNGRGSGVENEVDRGYMAAALISAGVNLKAATEALVRQFPDTAEVRRGTRSQFSPGPLANRRRAGR